MIDLLSAIKAIEQELAKGTSGKWFYVASLPPDPHRGLPNGQPAAICVSELVDSDTNHYEPKEIISPLSDPDARNITALINSIPIVLAAAREQIQGAAACIEWRDAYTLGTEDCPQNTTLAARYNARAGGMLDVARALLAPIFTCNEYYDLPAIRVFEH